ncbi:MAG: hypothetical protein V1887_02395 [Candidatus Aenigmatarchaeota archaeon]
MRIRPAKLSDVGRIYEIARDELSREEWFDNGKDAMIFCKDL